ncbi:MAG: hypothetical protein JNK49_18620 [Planctomycetes bacterium]|nr:hypothetical protein [Planctomycetota bacterium]
MRQSATRAPYQISMVSKDQSRTLVLSGDQAAVRATIAALHEIDAPKR